MFNIIKTAADTYHVFDGSRNDSMLYRYGILTADNELDNDNVCKQSKDKVIFDASKRKIEIASEHLDVGFRLRIPLSHDERLFGLGDATRDSVMVRGTRADIYIENVRAYGPMTVILSSDGWGFVLNCTYHNVIDCGKTDKDAIVIETNGGNVDYYLFRGDTLKEIIEKVTAVTGRPIMLPKFAYGLTFVQNEETDARSFLWDIKTMRDRGISCDVMGLEPSWMEKHYDYSTDKKWNKSLFPLPVWEDSNTSSFFTFFYPMREMGMQLSLWLCTEYDLFYKEDENLKEDSIASFDDKATIKDEHFSSEIRMDTYTKPEEPWFEHLKKFVDNGAAAFKCDGANQIISHPDRLWGGKYKDAEVHNVYPVILSKQLQQGFREYTDRRLLLYSSGAYTGTQRYAATWAGDTGGGFDTLVSIMNYAMCGHSNASCDIDIQSPEAIHYGFLTPWAQYFCWSNWRYPWFLNPKTEEMIKFYSNLRSSLVPYIYTMAHIANKTGTAILRPLALEFDGTDKFDNIKNEYMLGDSLLVGAFDMNLVLPDGKWTDYITGVRYEGNVKYEIPEGMGGALLVREGSVFVTMKPQKYILEKQHDYIINVYPGCDGEFTLYEDDGFTFDYEKGIYAQTLIKMSDTSSDGFDLTVFRRSGDFPGRPDNGHDNAQNSIPKIKAMQPINDMTVKISGRKPKTIIFNDKEIDFEYDGKFAKFVLTSDVHDSVDAKYVVKYC